MCITLLRSQLFLPYDFLSIAMLAVLLLSLLLVYLVYVKRTYFTLRGPIPGSPPAFLLGNLIESGQLFRGVSLTQALLTYKKRFGDIFQLWMGPTRFIVVGNINDVQHIFSHRNIYEQGKGFLEQVSVIFPNGLICIQGAAFKRHAALTIPIFRRAKVVSNFDLILESTDRLLKIWRTYPPATIHTNIVQQSQNLFLAIFGYIGFDYDLQTLNDNGQESTNELTQALYHMMSMFEMIAYSPRILSIIYTKVSWSYRRSRAIVRKYVDQMIDKELRGSLESRGERKRTCLIASLVASLQADEQQEARKPIEERKGLSREEIFDETVLFLNAGYETTSTAMSWFIYWMSKNPRVQQKIKAELREKGDNQPLTSAYLDSLTYLDCVLKEVFRISQPLPGTQRTLTTDDRLPDSGFQLYKGETVMIPFQNLSYDDRFWSIDPELFHPERFLDADEHHHAYAFLPFGSGHRQCVGQDLARFELKLIAARLMQCITFGDGGPEVNSGGHRTVVTIMPKHVGVTIRFD